MFSCPGWRLNSYALKGYRWINTFTLHLLKLKNTNNPFVKNTIIWNAVQKFLGELPRLSCFSPIWGNDFFTPAKNDMGFNTWLNKGIKRLQDIYPHYTLMSFIDFKAKFDIPQKHFF